MVKLSVIMPISNTNEKCLDSIVNQTLSDIEIICIDYKPDDASRDIFNSYASRDDRITIVSHDNLEPTSIRNNGIDLAKGEYVFFIDGSDWLELDAFEKLYGNAKSNDSDIVLFNVTEHINDNNINKYSYLPIDDGVDYTHSTLDLNQEKQLVMNEKFFDSKIYRTSFIKNNCHDFSNNIKLHVKSMLCAKRISYLPECLYNSNRLYPCDLSIFDTFDDIEEFLLENDFFKEFKLNFYEFKIKQSKNYLDNCSNESKEGFYADLRKEFIHWNIKTDELPCLDKSEYKFFMRVLNIGDFEYYKKFNRVVKKPEKYIDKREIQSEIDSFDSLGVTQDKREQKLIVSLTSFPERMYDIHFCLYSLLNQDLKPDEVILWLSDEQFPNKEKDLPDSVLNLKRNGLTIKWCENISSYKKLIPSLRQYPNDFIITADDDIFYPKNWLKQIWDEYEKCPNHIITSRSRKISIKNGKFTKYLSWKLIEDDESPSFLIFPTNGAGTLFFPNSLSDKVFDEKAFSEICPYSDDIWFWAMMILNHAKIKVVPNSNMIYLRYVNVAREYGFLDDKTLWRSNSIGDNDSTFNELLNTFPEILKTINPHEEDDL